MPRPKVLPSQRQRAAEACNFCRNSKKRCSATVPCTACQRRGISASCSLTYLPRGSRARIPVDKGGPESLPPPPPPKSVPLHAELVSLRSGNDPGLAVAGPGFRPVVSTCRDAASPALDPAREWTPTTARQALGESSQSALSASRTSLPDATGQSSRKSPSAANERELNVRMLLDLRGERVYIGEAASLSFLQFVRQTVAAQIGPSQFSHNDKSDTMLETEPASIRSHPLDSPPERTLSLADSLVCAQLFQTATAGLLHVFSPAEIEGLLQARTGDVRMIPCRKAAADLIVAIGAQCKSPADAQVGQVYFRHAQRTAFSGMLEDPNIDMVRAFLLMSFYMLGHCRRNTAFMYLGIAIRAAIALGMHRRESYTDATSPAHQTSRLQVWMSACLLDMAVSSILGRPPATSGLRSELESSLIDPLYDEISRQQEGVACLFASYKVLSIISESLDSFYSKEHASTELVERFLGRIGDWSRGLPVSLRQPSERDAQAGGKATIGGIHVSCLYYFSVTLITRPILISWLTSQRTAGTTSPETASLGAACLDAAVYLVQTCAEALRAGLLLGNMCIMKALVFAAGLILGFTMFAKKEMDFEIEAMFRSACEVLEFLAMQSPQAAHYAEILGLLGNAVTEQRRKQAARPRSRYVGRIFSLHGAGTADDSTVQQQRQTASVATVAARRGLGDADVAWLPGEQDMEGDMLRWDNLDLSQWDSFPFPSPKVFYTE